MGRASRVLVGAMAVSAGLFALGFLLFALTVTQEPSGSEASADGIVVLTGGEQRILEGARLLRLGRARRLLISGVNARTSRDDIQRLTGLSETGFACCVDLGYRALDTVGNAEEARAWAAERRYGSLIVVTSSYHMPRSLAELSLALPAVTLVPHPVALRAGKTWWLTPGTARVLVSEYLKFLPAAARAATARLVRGWEGGSLAQVPGNRPTKL
jgi:uncharacterized SAM-binding protein YcdF (DUF218 family)